MYIFHLNNLSVCACSCVHEYTCICAQVHMGVLACTNIYMCSNVRCGGQKPTTSHSPQMPFTLFLENGCLPLLELAK